MIRAKIKLRVRYSETDQMGFVYHGNYAQYLEVGRVETLKTIGISYRELEEKGFGLPVKSLHIDYLRAAQYDDELTITTSIEEKPTNIIVFTYKIHREEELLVRAKTELFFIDSNKRACRPPKFFAELVATYFS